MGSLAYKDAPLANLEAAGAVMHIQTTVPELYMSVSASTYAWGTTRNPWNLDYSPGGSSSGSSAALAAGFATLATGSDMGGSIRLPACWVRVLAVARLGAHYPRIRESFQRL